MMLVILAGGLGTRLSEETVTKPKPMVEIGGRPIIWHIMKYFYSFGVEDFVICLGYKGYVIKEFFLNYKLHLSDVTIHTASGKVDFHRTAAENWRIRLVETGDATMTGGRLRRVRDYLDGEDFFMTYGDGLSDVDLNRLALFHRAQGRLATVTAVSPPGRFGALEIAEGRVARFHEKPRGDGGRINGGFFVLAPGALDYVEGDATVWETEPMERLAQEGQLAAYSHEGFWQAMDTLRDKTHLETLWTEKRAPWRVW